MISPKRALTAAHVVKDYVDLFIYTSGDRPQAELKSTIAIYKQRGFAKKLGLQRVQLISDIDAADATLVAESQYRPDGWRNGADVALLELTEPCTLGAAKPRRR